MERSGGMGQGGCFMFALVWASRGEFVQGDYEHLHEFAWWKMTRRLSGMDLLEASASAVFGCRTKHSGARR